MIPVTDRLAIDEDEIEEVFVRARSQIMRRWFYIDGRSLGLLLRQLQHVCGEINVILLAIAIGLAILDYTYFLILGLAAAMARVGLPVWILDARVHEIKGNSKTATREDAGSRL